MGCVPEEGEGREGRAGLPGWVCQRLARGWRRNRAAARVRSELILIPAGLLGQLGLAFPKYYRDGTVMCTPKSSSWE